MPLLTSFARRASRWRSRPTPLREGRPCGMPFPHAPLPHRHRPHRAALTSLHPPMFLPRIPLPLTLSALALPRLALLLLLPVPPPSCLRRPLPLPPHPPHPRNSSLMCREPVDERPPGYPCAAGPRVDAPGGWHSALADQQLGSPRRRRRRDRRRRLPRRWRLGSQHRLGSPHRLVTQDDTAVARRRRPGHRGRNRGAGVRMAAQPSWMTSKSCCSTARVY